MLKKIEAGENITKPWVRVRHLVLKRVNETSPFRSWCPVCDQGIMLVHREGVELLRVDHCSMCGQRFIYEDDEIEGMPLKPPMAELLPALQHEVTTKLRNRFTRIDDE
jgi:hypothetical protein